MAHEPGRSKRAVSMSSDEDDVKPPSTHAKNRSPSVLSTADGRLSQVTRKAGLGMGRKKLTRTFFSLDEDLILIEFAATRPEFGGKKKTGASLGVAFCEKYPKIGQRHPPVSVMTRLKKIKEHIEKYDVPLEWKYALTENPVYLVLTERARKKHKNANSQKANRPTTSRVSEEDTFPRQRRGEGSFKRAKLDVSDSETDPEIPPIDKQHEERGSTDGNTPKRTAAHSVDADRKRGDVRINGHDKIGDKAINSKVNGNKQRLSNLSSPDVIASSTDLMALQPRTIRKGQYGMAPVDDRYEERSVIPASYETNPSTSQQKDLNRGKRRKNTAVPAVPATVRNDHPDHDGQSVSGKAKNYLQSANDKTVQKDGNKMADRFAQKQAIDAMYRKLANSSSKTPRAVAKSGEKSAYCFPEDSDADEPDDIPFSSDSEIVNSDNSANGAAGIRIGQVARHRSRSESTDTSEPRRLGKSDKPPADALVKKRHQIVTRTKRDVAVDRESSEEIPEPKSVSPKKDRDVVIPGKIKLRKGLATEKHTSRPPSPMRLDVACQTVQSTIGQPDKAKQRVLTVDQGCQTKNRKPPSRDQATQLHTATNGLTQHQTCQTGQSWFTMVENGVQTSKVATKDQGCQMREPVIMRVNRASSPIAAVSLVNRASSPVTVVSCVDRASSPIRFETEKKNSGLVSPADKKNDLEASPAASDTEMSDLGTSSMGVEPRASLARGSVSKSGVPSALKVGIFGTKKTASSEKDGSDEKTHYRSSRTGKFLSGSIKSERTKRVETDLGQQKLNVILYKSTTSARPLELKNSAGRSSVSPEVPEIIPLRPRQRQVHFTTASPEIIQQNSYQSSPGDRSAERGTPDTFYHPLPTPSDEEESPPRFSQRIQPTQYVAVAQLQKETTLNGGAESVAAELPSGETDYFSAQSTQSTGVSVDLAVASQESGSSAKTLRFGSESCTPPDELLGTDKLKLDAEMVGQLAEKYGITPKEMLYAFFRSNGSILDAMAWLVKGDCAPASSSAVPTFVLDRALLEDTVENVARGPAGRARSPSMLKERAVYLNHDREALEAELEERGTTVVEMLRLFYDSQPDFVGGE